ncbi:hypothetical protein [Synechococcus sp. PCC 6312]|uniref:hypothetical protein n=1 Tax=Synechococcus sp. (strain ATCC 27167 / PCC 6312) TaxID=195253 RepID=UPI00029EF80E|nr:hypothetical protein [Synechococcus sp. PCC 6312]AFY62392.1 hypothetical protein Syn6312_3360 [Synechococcus sp. PCC 6312]
MAIDFFIWDLVKDFTIFNAACLWCELDPNRVDTNNIPSNVEALMGVIEQEVGGYRGDKIAGNKLRVGINPKFSRSCSEMEPIPVSREDLRKWAKSKDQYPPFLFKESRVVSGLEKKLHPNERRTLLEIVKRLLESQHVDISKKEATAKFMSLAGISDNTARKYLNEMRELD